MLESKAQSNEKAQHTRQYVSILNRIATQLSGIRWGYENGFKLFLHLLNNKQDQAPIHHLLQPLHAP